LKDGNWTRSNSTIDKSTLLAYDAKDGYVLGYETNSSSDSTWEFSNGSWSKLQTTTSPPPDESGALAYDAGSGYVLYVDTGNGATTTWAWSDGNWTVLNLTSEPSLGGAPSINSMTYDYADGYMVLVHAINFTCGSRASCLDTWTYGQGAWTDISGATTTNPPTLFDPSLTYDAAAQKVVLFGGYEVEVGSCPECASNQTWEYSAGKWAEVQPTATPAPRYLAGMAYDSNLSEVMILGGVGITESGGMPASYPLADEWGFGSNTWTKLLPAASATYPVLDVGITTSIVTSVPPVFGTPAINYANLPPGCESSNSTALACTPAAEGTFDVLVSFTYGTGAKSSVPLSLVVHADPQVTAFYATANPVASNATTLLEAAVDGGTLPYVYVYSGLPSWCQTTNETQVDCRPTQPGNFSIGLSVTDSVGRRANSNLVLIVQGGVPGKGIRAASPILPVGEAAGLTGIIVAAVCSTLFLGWRARLRQDGKRLIEEMRRRIHERPP